MTFRKPSIGFIVASNDNQVLESNLLASPDLRSLDVSVYRNFRSAGLAYNAGIQESSEDILIFVHQDVFLPEGWIDGFIRNLMWLESADPHWGVLGAFGLTLDGHDCGCLYSVGLQKVLGRPFARPRQIRVLDEVLLVIRRDSLLLFDDCLPGFHLYGTDICLQAEARGLKCYAIPCFMIHNSKGVRTLPRAFWRCYKYLQHKWMQSLPVVTPCVTISPSWAGRFAALCKDKMYGWLVRSGQIGRRLADPRVILQESTISDMIGHSNEQ